MARVDVLVAGAGPAGAAAAIAAADRGLDVRRVRPGSLPAGQDVRRRPHDPGAAPARAPRPRPCGPRSGPGTSPVHEAVLVSPRGREINLPLPTDGEHAGVVRRAGLDAALARLARAPGVDVREGVARDRPRRRGRRREGARRHGRNDRGAPSRCRRRSLVDRAPAPPSRRARDLGTWHAVRQYFDGVDDARLWSFFFEDLLPGYAWVFPTSRRRRQRRLRRAA